MTWSTCKPISEIGGYIHLLGDRKIPEDSTCFLDNHMSYISFYSYPSLADNYGYFFLLVLGLLVLVGFLVKPTLNLLFRKRK